MHEMSLCEGIREVLTEQALAHDATRITRVRLEIGRFAGVERRALDFAFDVVMRGSPAEGAVLEVIDLPARAVCYGCGATVELTGRLDPCPDCGSGRVSPISGDEMRIKDLELI